MKNQAHVEKLLAVTGRLNALIRRENELLGALRHAEIKPVLEEKQMLSAVYARHYQALREAESLSDVDPALRRQLAETLAEFGTLLEENKMRLAANLEASRAMFAVIAEAAREHQATSHVYGKSGEIRDAGSKGFKPALSVGLNQEL
jgi:3-dehydroquinate dehydratase